jgi:hypothetical protein
LVFGVLALLAATFVSFGLAVADAPGWLFYVTGTLCLGAAVFRTAGLNVPRDAARRHRAPKGRSVLPH